MHPDPSAVQKMGLTDMLNANQNEAGQGLVNRKHKTDVGEHAHHQPFFKIDLQASLRSAKQGRHE